MSVGNAYRNRINVMRKGLPSTDWIPPVLAWYRKFKAGSLPNSQRLLALDTFALADLEARHGDLLGRLAASYRHKS